MGKYFNILLFALVIIFLFSTYKYYSSNKNIEIKNYNRKNIDEIISNKISNLPIINNDTDNVIEFNDGYSNNIKKENPRSFWKLLKFE
tara:strand:- start:185 stop:448 length:264 start_codon:yes stop_codon:yes gene_type:complete